MSETIRTIPSNASAVLGGFPTAQSHPAGPFANCSFESARVRRVLIVIAGIWLISAADVAMTLAAMKSGIFIEANPFAHAYLGRGDFLALFKVMSIVPVSVVFYHYRRSRTVEIACGFVLAVFAALAGAWAWYHVTIVGV